MGTVGYSLDMETENAVNRRGAWQTLDYLFCQARNGNRRAALVVGAPGMGKTALIQEMQARAEASGAIVLAAAASAAERDCPMSLFSRLLTTATLPPDQACLVWQLEVSRLLASVQPDAASPAAPAISAIVDGIYCLIRCLADRNPLVIIIDDAHDIDPDSLQCLLNLMRRLGMARILIVLAGRTDGSPGPPTPTAEFVSDPRCVLIHVEPFSVEYADSMLAQHMEPEAARSVARDWHRASGGSPLLLRALLKDRDGSDAGLAHPMPGQAFRLAVRHLLSHLGESALLTARGLAVLGSTATPDRLDRLLNLPSGGAARALGMLDAVGLTETAAYRIDATGAIVLDDMASPDRAELHRKTARILCDDGAEMTVVAGHLVDGAPLPDGWAIPLLRDAAAQALRVNDAQLAIACLRVAHKACQDERQLPLLRADLARAQWEADPAIVQRHLTPLVQYHRRGQLDPRRSMRLITYLLWHGQPEVADDLFADLDSMHDKLPAESAARLERMRIWFAHFYPDLGARYHPRAALSEMALGQSVSGTDPQTDGALLLHAVQSTGPTRSVLDTAEWLLQGLVLHDPPVFPAIAALATFIQAARLDRAAEWCDLLLRNAQHRTPTARAILAAVSATIESLLGNAEPARQRADEALSLIASRGWGIAVGMPLSAKVLACIALADREGAAECFRVPVPKAMFQTLPGLYYLQARGRFQLSVGRYRAALADCYACRDLMAAWNLDVSASVPWQVSAAEALIELSHPDEARALLVTELTRPDAHLRQSTAAARRLLERLGSLARPGKIARPAGDPIRNGAARADPRPPRAQAGRDPVAGLSKAEQRVAGLASLGCSNREIAAKLFVTTSTVEQHLTRVYQKLGVRGRGDLPSVLVPGTASG